MEQHFVQRLLRQRQRPHTSFLVSRISGVILAPAFLISSLCVKARSLIACRHRIIQVTLTCSKAELPGRTSSSLSSSMRTVTSMRMRSRESFDRPLESRASHNCA